mmetsp:Transcript_110099/g.344319  ORF Transcript_110099/g.344319 Transcript_110099/m.344319 type:complete len:246 (+) Transcript_110099:1292-2029(+)
MAARSAGPWLAPPVLQAQRWGCRDPRRRCCRVRAVASSRAPRKVAPLCQRRPWGPPAQLPWSPQPAGLDPGLLGKPTEPAARGLPMSLAEESLLQLEQGPLAARPARRWQRRGPRFQLLAQMAAAPSSAVVQPDLPGPEPSRPARRPPEVAPTRDKLAEAPSSAKPSRQWQQWEPALVSPPLPGRPSTAVCLSPPVAEPSWAATRLPCSRASPAAQRRSPRPRRRGPGDPMTRLAGWRRTQASEC